jgi:hypothetical protein
MLGTGSVRNYEVWSDAPQGELEMKKRHMIAAVAFALCFGFASSSSAIRGNVLEPVGDLLHHDHEQGAAPVPEPSSALIFGTGLLVAAAVRRQRRLS